jgi:hypothetical protein
LADFVQAVNGWSHMFFSKEDAVEQDKAWNPTFPDREKVREVQEDDF